MHSGARSYSEERPSDIGSEDIEQMITEVNTFLAKQDSIYHWLSEVELIFPLCPPYTHVKEMDISHKEPQKHVDAISCSDVYHEQSFVQKMEDIAAHCAILYEIDNAHDTPLAPPNTISTDNYPRGPLYNTSSYDQSSTEFSRSDVGTSSEGDSHIIVRTATAKIFKETAIDMHPVPEENDIHDLTHARVQTIAQFKWVNWTAKWIVEVAQMAMDPWDEEGIREAERKMFGFLFERNGGVIDKDDDWRMSDAQTVSYLDDSE
jgi:hypothetical protein